MSRAAERLMKHGGRLARLRRACALRPLLTGWFAEFAALADHCRDAVRLGPAPYLADAQLKAAMAHLGVCLRER